MAKKNGSVKKIAKESKPNWTVARSDDGTIQVTFTIPYSDIKTEREKAAAELGKDMEIAGFRKGKAPVEKVIEKIDNNKLLEHTLSHILPGLLGDVIKKEDLKLAIYPKFELIKAVDGEDWQIRATTCELPEIELGDYKKIVKESAGKGKIWTPGSDKEEKEPGPQEKEQMVLKALVESVKVDIPKILIDEEVNAKLANLLERIEKLGLNLDSYLSSVGKTAQTLRSEYEKQAKDALIIDILLSKIADKEDIKVPNTDIDSAITAAKTDPNVTDDIDSPQRRQFIESILKRRKALSHLVELT